MASKSVSVTACVKSAHHWVIDMPNGRTSQGVCKYCGKDKEFKNSAASDRAGGWNSNSDLFKRLVPDPRTNGHAMSDDR